MTAFLRLSLPWLLLALVLALALAGGLVLASRR